jgi:hypothetical protein
MKSKQIMEAALKLVTCKKDSPKFLAAYREVDSAFKKFIPLNIHFTLLRSDGRCIFSSENDAQWVIDNTDDFNTRLEVNQAISHHHGYGILDFSTRDKKRILHIVQKLMLKGYGSARRVGSVSGNLENYVAFTFTPNGNKLPSEKTCTYRLSQKVD